MRNSEEKVTDWPLVTRVLSKFQKGFKDGISHEQIAKDLRTPPAKVRAIIKKAKSEEWIRININLPSLDKLENELKGLFNPEVSKDRAIRAIVVDVGELGSKFEPQMLGATAARFFEEVVRPESAIAIDGGRSVCSVIEAHNEITGLTVYPVAGGPLDNEFFSIHALIGRFRGKYGWDSGLETPISLPSPEMVKEKHRPPRCNHRTISLPSPEMVKEKDNVQDYLREHSKVQDDLKRIATANVYLLGIGAFYSDGGLTATAKELLEILHIDRGSIPQQAVGVCGYNVYDRDGNWIESPFDKKVVKIGAETIQNAAKDKKKTVILVAWGPHKAKAILAALKGGWGNCLVTDLTTAKEIVEL